MQDNYSVDLVSLTERYGKDALESLFEIFLRKMPLELQRLKNAMPSRNKAEITEMIHGLKGSCSVLFANRMKQNCVDLEDAVSRDDWDEAESLNEYLYGSFDLLRKELQDSEQDRAQNDFAGK